MAEKKNSRQVNAEIKRLKGLLADFNVSEKRINMLGPVIENTAVMKVKLDETKALIESSSVVIKYDNGGGQSGIRENPIFKGYEALFKSYMQGIDRLFSVLPEEKVVEETKEVKPQTVLELVRARKQA